MKKIALGIALAILSVTSVASGTIVVRQHSEASEDRQAATIEAKNEHLAADCWLVTGATKNAGCTTSVTDPATPDLPGVSDLTDLIALPDASGLPDVPDLTDLPDVPGVPAVPGLPALSACQAALPVAVPLPVSTFAAGKDIADSLAAFALSQLQPPALPVAVPSLPVAVPSVAAPPVGVPDVVEILKNEAGCVPISDSGPAPSLCNGTLGAPLAAPGPLSGLLGSLTQDLAAITGQGVTVNSGNSVGINCTLPSLPLPPISVPQIPSVVAPQVTVPTLPSLPTVTAPTIPSLPSGITVPSVPPISIPDLPVSVPSLPILSCSASGSGSASHGLLGSLTATITGTC